MALLLTAPPSLSLLSKKSPSLLPFRASKAHSLSSSLLPRTTPKSRFPAFRLFCTLSGDSTGDSPPSGISDEWGEKAEPETEPPTRLSDADPAKDEDEWGGVGVGDGDGDGDGDDYVMSGNGSAAAGGTAGMVDDKLMGLKRCLVDSIYGSDLGFRASREVRAEAAELANQLEAANPTPAPTEAVELLDGNWVLVYTAFSELLPLLAVGTIPLLKVERICQNINISSRIIENSIIFSSPFATFSFSASATFDVQTPSRIQVQFKEGTLKPPEIKSRIDLPENINIFGQRISLSPVQQSLSPLQEAVGSISRAISGQSPLRFPIPGERTQSWLLTTYLDEDLRISRGDGGLFVLVKEGSPLLDQ